MDVVGDPLGNLEVGSRPLPWAAPQDRLMCRARLHGVVPRLTTAIITRRMGW